MKALFFITLAFFAYKCSAQDSTSERNRLTGTIIEKFYALRSNKQIRTGQYIAIYRHNTPLASGRYINNKKVGTWHFYDTGGTLIENFDYNRNVLLYEKPDDSISAQQIRYAFDDTIPDSTHITKPVKPGGRYYGYLPYLRIFKLSDDFIGTDPSFFTAVLEILVSPGGRLADFKVHIKSEDFERITTFSTELINDEDKVFIPATINGRPVISRIFVKCRLTTDGELDVD